MGMSDHVYAATEEMQRNQSEEIDRLTKQRDELRQLVNHTAALKAQGEPVAWFFNGEDGLWLNIECDGKHYGVNLSNDKISRPVSIAIVNKYCGGKAGTGRVGATPQPAHGEPVHQWRRTAGDGRWRDAAEAEAYARVDDCYEARTLYTAPQPAGNAELVKALRAAHRMLTRDYIDPAKMAVVEQVAAAVKLATGEELL